MKKQLAILAAACLMVAGCDNADRGGSDIDSTMDTTIDSGTSEIQTSPDLMTTNNAQGGTTNNLETSSGAGASTTETNTNNTTGQ